MQYQRLFFISSGYVAKNCTFILHRLLRLSHIKNSTDVNVQYQHRFSLPVMVSNDGCQSSDTYSVAHQMDFLTQNVFHPARSSRQQQIYFECVDGKSKMTMLRGLGFLKASHQSYLPFGSNPITEVRNTRRPTPVKARVTLVERQTGRVYIDVDQWIRQQHFCKRKEGFHVLSLCEIPCYEIALHHYKISLKRRTTLMTCKGWSRRERFLLSIKRISLSYTPCCRWE